MNETTPIASAAPPQQQADPEINLRLLLQEMVQKGASDLHVTAGVKAKIRVDGELRDSSINYVLKPKDTLQIAYSILTEHQKKRYETEDELDFSFGDQNLSRFRGNVFKQRGCVAMAIRQIPYEITTVEKLGMPPILATLADRPARARSHNGSHRLREVDHAGRFAGQDQPRAPRAHHHDRGPHRVHPQAPTVYGEPA